MSVYPIRVSKFYKVCWRVFGEVRFPLRFSNFSKRMYGNFTHVFLLVYKERLNVSYRRFVKIASESEWTRMLGIKRVPHYTTLQKFLQKVNKPIFEKLVRACHKLLDCKEIEACIDGTGFSNTNPSAYYTKRIDGGYVKNFTKTTFLTDNKTKLVLNIRTHSDQTHEIKNFIPLIEPLKNKLATVLGDKAYDARSAREYCRTNGIKPCIPIRQYTIQVDRNDKQHYSKQRRLELAEFDADLYRKRSLIESINSAIKRPFGGWVTNRSPANQQKQATLKALAYNLEILERTLKQWLYKNLKGFLQTL